MAHERSLTVSRVARLTGVSVRTLHHYDEIGLVRPSGRTTAGYRLYGPGDLERLQQVLFFRELGFPLDEIGRILADPKFDLGAALRTQRQMLTERAVRIDALIAAVDQAIGRLDQGSAMTETEMKEMFQGFDHAAYEKEAEQRWGDSPAFQESKRRTARYTRQDWEAIKAEGGAIYTRLAKLMQAGVSATATEAMDAAEEHRQHISRWFYDCSHAIHRGLGQLYIDDPRFTANIDRFGAGLSAYLRDTFAANADRSEG